MVNQLFFEKNLVHNLIWNMMQKDELINSCLHWPTFEVSPSVRKLCKIENSLSKQKTDQIEVVTMDIIESGNIIEYFTLLCDEIFANLSNAHLIALIYVTSELAKHFLKSHDFIQINFIINVLQSKITSYNKHNFKKLGLCSFLSAFALLIFVLLPEILF